MRAGRADEAARPLRTDGPGRDAALQSLAQENALLVRELGRVQRRCTQWRDECAAQAERLEARLIRARAEILVKETLLASLRDSLDARRRSRPEHQLAASRRRPPEPDAAVVARRAAADDGAAARPDGPAARVLCVGGRARQVPVYRELVERRGGRFTHVDGGGADGLAELARALARADVVILQPGYVCQGACRVVHAHCARTGLRCVALDKPCVLGFEHCLAQALAPPGGS